ncbi:MAG: HlyD family efflux transporter periplasmic adaptor subunit [Chitinophaga sp.]|uniref:efflux RND transporter periplasmic adaptor subunit n=1 Tax=Chitinophaga sp. TaxID=1869181 RepID=UPI0025BC92F1|nr:HlyD family efflux transporter periplasmic adaptor subunit [Chitinophaga sp.]MBV8251969.1 HlyD family efflux transporter periplasmic adaptor subunit [Chitinophaga sp.]
MDKAISHQELSRNRKKRYLLIGAILIIVTVAAFFLRKVFKPNVNRQSFTTAVVERGNVENTLTASGTVVPEFEELITSSVQASVQQVLLDAGSAVAKGQSVLLLDKSATQLQCQNLKFQLELKRNNIRKMKLDLDRSFFDLQSGNKVKQLQINSLEAAVENAKRLFKAGGGTREDIEQATMNLQVAQQEKIRLENEINSKQQTMQLDIHETEIAAKIQENELRELERKLQQADVVASRAGVVTWINKNIGAAVREGDALARIADLGSFKINGSISDSYADQIHIGLPVIINLNDTYVRGTIANIHPAVENSILSFDVQLSDRNNKLLRPNMKLDIYVVTNQHNNVLRVANGPAFRGGSVQELFVVKGNKAFRKKVNLGLSNFGFVEITAGLQAGEEVIISDMKDFNNTTEITINQ